MTPRPPSPSASGPEFGTQAYPWQQHYEHRSARLSDHYDEAWTHARQAGLDLWEDTVQTSEDVRRFRRMQSDFGLTLRSVYQHVAIHDDDWRETVEGLVRQAAFAREAGADILAFNPAPRDWSRPLDKDERQLANQAAAMNALGEKVRSFGMKLGYHTHDAEMRHEAKEFLFMADHTDPALVGLCFDPHWVWRGAGNDALTLNRIVSRYGDRILSLHLRQSLDGVWSETFGEGDIDYHPLMATLRRHGFSGPVLLEIAREEGTPESLDVVEAHRRGLDYARRLFAIPPAVEVIPADRVERLYLVGAGVIAREHVRAAARLPDRDDLEIQAADPSPEARALFAREFPRARLHADAGAMLTEPSRPGDIVIIATPPYLHADAARLAVSGGRHVLSEKPLTLTLAEADALFELAAARGVFLGCCSCRFRGVPTTREVRRRMNAGELGRIHRLTWISRRQRDRSGIEYQGASRWFLDSRKNGGGPLSDWGVYDIAAMTDLLEPVRVDVCHAWTARAHTAADPVDCIYDVEDSAGASLRFHRADGLTVEVAYERATCTHGEERLVTELEGTRGAASWDWLNWHGPGRVTLGHDAGGCPQSETLFTPAPLDNACHLRPLHSFIDAIEGRPNDALLGESARFHFAIVRAIFDVAATRRARSVFRAGAGPLPAPQPDSP